MVGNNIIGMNTRQAQILNYIVKDYIRSAMPVSSGVLAEKYGLSVSPATVRNEMAVLTDEGYIAKPHTSAGRMPTERGYRFFVDEILARAERDLLARRREALMRKKVSEVLESFTLDSREAVNCLADLSETLVIYGSRKSFAMGGLSYLLEEPEFAEISTARRLVRFLEQASGEFMENADESLGEEHIRVFVGSENISPNIRECSMIVSSFSPRRQAERKMIAMIGPLRMRYNEHIALLRSLQSMFEI